MHLTLINFYLDSKRHLSTFKAKFRLFYRFSNLTRYDTKFRQMNYESIYTDSYSVC